MEMVREMSPIKYIVRAEVDKTTRDKLKAYVDKSGDFVSIPELIRDVLRHFVSSNEVEKFLKQK